MNTRCPTLNALDLREEPRRPVNSYVQHVTATDTPIVAQLLLRRR